MEDFPERWQKLETPEDLKERPDLTSWRLTKMNISMEVNMARRKSRETGRKRRHGHMSSCKAFHVWNQRWAALFVQNIENNLNQMAQLQPPSLGESICVLYFKKFNWWIHHFDFIDNNIWRYIDICWRLTRLKSKSAPFFLQKGSSSIIHCVDLWKMCSS